MLLYIFLAILTLVCAFVIRGNKLKGLMFFSVLIVMLLLCGLRGAQCGTDTYNYWRMAWGTYGGEIPFIYEPLLKFSRCFPLSHVVFCLCMAGLCYVPLMYILNKYSDNKCLSVFLYMATGGLFFLEGFNLAKQSVSLSFVLLAVALYEDRKKLASCISYLFAILFHPFALLLLPLPLLSKIKFSKPRVVIILGLSMFLGIVFSVVLMGDIIEKVTSVVGGSSFYIFNHLSKYSHYNYTYNVSFIGAMSHMLPMVILCLIIYSNQIANNLFYKMLLFGTVILCLNIGSLFCERTAAFYTIAVIIAYPNSLKYVTCKQRKRIRYFCIVLLALYIYNMNVMQSLGRSGELATPVPYMSFITSPF